MPRRSESPLHPSAAIVTAIVIAMAGSSCTRYHGKPISPGSATEALAVPDAAWIRASAESLRHPLLRPLPIDLDRPLDPDSAAVLAVILNPSLRAIRDQRRLADAQVLQAGILPNPQLSLSGEAPTGGDLNGTTKGFGLGLSWEATALITRGSRRRSAEDQAGSIDLSIAWQEWQVAQGAKQGFYRVKAATERSAIADEADGFLSQQRQAIEDAMAQGLTTAAEVATAEAASQDARVLALDARDDLDKQRLAFARVLGLPPGSAIPIEAAPWPTASPPKDGLEAAIEASRIDLAALRMGYSAQEESLRTAVLGQFPKVSIGFTHARDTGNVQATGIGITIDLPIFDRNQGAIAIETATRQRLFDEYIQRVFEARHDLAAALADAEAIAGRIRETDRTIDIYRQRERAWRVALEERYVDAPSLQQATAALTLKRLEAVQWRQRLAEARIAIELAAGRYLPIPVNEVLP